jgi:leader peptidase (prepilin peptidase)/N-methyltransferase
VLGWLILRGRCRSCRAPISPRYPAVELLNGLLYLGLALLFGASVATLVKMALATALVVLALVDLDHHILPDAITLSFLAAGLFVGALLAPAPGPRRLLAALGGLGLGAFTGMVLGWDRRRDADAAFPDLPGLAMLLVFLAWQVWLRMPVERVATAAGGYLVMAALAWAAARYFGQEALGQGDWKMVAMLGAFLGIQGTLLAVFLGTLTGALYGLALIALGRGSRRTPVPFGTFLSLGGLAVLLAGGPLLRWYGGLYRG